mgnify:CR=1 FL=1
MHFAQLHASSVVNPCSVGTPSGVRCIFFPHAGPIGIEVLQTPSFPRCFSPNKANPYRFLVPCNKSFNTCDGVFDSDEEHILNRFSELSKEKNYLKIYNKTDLGYVVRDGVFDCMVSAKTGEGFDGLKKLISNAFKTDVSGDYMYLVRDRHIKLFQSSINHLEEALLKLVDGGGLELIAEDLRLARNDLNEIIGVKMSDSLLGDIFSSFCIGK